MNEFTITVSKEQQEAIIKELTKSFKAVIDESIEEATEITYLTKKDLAKMLRISSSSISNLEKKGMPAVRIGKAVRYNLKDVDIWIKENL